MKTFSRAGVALAFLSSAMIFAGLGCNGTGASSASGGTGETSTYTIVMLGKATLCGNFLNGPQSGKVAYKMQVNLAGIGLVTYNGTADLVEGRGCADMSATIHGEAGQVLAGDQVPETLQVIRDGSADAINGTIVNVTAPGQLLTIEAEFDSSKPNPGRPGLFAPAAKSSPFVTLGEATLCGDFPSGPVTGKAAYKMQVNLAGIGLVTYNGTADINQGRGCATMTATIVGEAGQVSRGDQVPETLQVVFDGGVDAVNGKITHVTTPGMLLTIEATFDASNPNPGLPGKL